MFEIRKHFRVGRLAAGKTFLYLQRREEPDLRIAGAGEVLGFSAAIIGKRMKQRQRRWLRSKVKILSRTALLNFRSQMTNFLWRWPCLLLNSVRWPGYHVRPSWTLATLRRRKMIEVEGATIRISNPGRREEVSG